MTYRLGLDIGSNSVGWAALGTEGGVPVEVLRAGVRIFEAGVQGDLERGKEESRGADRRRARLQRRQTDRRRRRLKAVYSLLADYGLLPHGKSARERDSNLTALDAELARRFPEARALPYFLRARALDQRLEPPELGRALYHLAQRRGFESNRKARQRETDEERGEVLKGIQSLYGSMAETGARTLGEYFARFLPPAERRIRCRWTHRRMYQQEFETIWAAQREFYPELLTRERHDQLFEAVFFQRPLKSQEELIGDCELEPGEKRAPLWHPLAQRFRMLQVVNDLRLSEPSGVERALTPEERRQLLAELEIKGDLTFAKVRHLLHLPRGVSLNREEGGNDKLVGNRTEARMRSWFGVRWDEMAPEQRTEAIEDLVSKLTEEELFGKAVDVWKLDGTLARGYSQSGLEEGKYLGYSLKAVGRLLPLMEAGQAFMTARHSLYPETLRLGAAEDALRPVTECVPDLRNPAVARALTEVRKIVNAMIREYGKPDEIHIELARDLKSPRKERENRWKRMREQEARRKEAAEKLAKEDGNPRPSAADIEKMLLMMECGCQCPYTGRTISMAAIRNGLVQVEHIIPFSRSLDDSFVNKTLCFVDENARKRNHTPWEFYGRTGGEEWERILDRVGKFQSRVARAKLERFQMREEQVDALLGDFSTRALNDTRFASKLAAHYLAHLYGGLSDEGGRQRVFATSGMLTARLRRLWSLSRLAGLSESGEKVRDDHRQHTLDAIIIGLTELRWVKRMADAAEYGRSQGRSRISSIEAPWDGFAADVGKAIDSLLVSHRPERKISGALHKETLYAERRRRDGSQFIAVRKPVNALTKGELASIVDTVVRGRVKLAVARAGDDPGKLNDGNAPTMPSGVPIRSVRVEVRKPLRSVGSGERLRLITGGDNQHFEVFSVLDRRGSVKRWDCVIVSKAEAAERVRTKRPVVCREHGPNTCFAFTIAKGDTFEIERDGVPEVVVARVLEGDKRVSLFSIRDARRQEKRNALRCTVNELMKKYKLQKVAITVLGEKIACRD
ncbi:MAG: type II CRISPR RNA-guided endonuclease Cas9 [Bryobacteraceae bacterium]|jgi:CRISPR-associated endonuclease Csn1